MKRLNETDLPGLSDGFYTIKSIVFVFKNIILILPGKMFIYVITL